MGMSISNGFKYGLPAAANTSPPTPAPAPNSRHAAPRSYPLVDGLGVQPVLPARPPQQRRERHDVLRGRHALCLEQQLVAVQPQRLVVEEELGAVLAQVVVQLLLEVRLERACRVGVGVGVAWMRVWWMGGRAGGVGGCGGGMWRARSPRHLPGRPQDQVPVLSTSQSPAWLVRAARKPPRNAPHTHCSTPWTAPCACSSWRAAAAAGCAPSRATSAAWRRCSSCTSLSPARSSGGAWPAAGPRTWPRWPGGTSATPGGRPAGGTGGEGEGGGGVLGIAVHNQPG